MTVKIYGPTASRAARALWIVHELGIPFEHVALEMKDLKGPEFLKINPNARVPVIVDHDGRAELIHDFLDADVADAHMHTLDGEVRWEQAEVIVFGRRVREPRMSVWYAENGMDYRYSTRLYWDCQMWMQISIRLLMSSHLETCLD